MRLESGVRRPESKTREQMKKWFVVGGQQERQPPVFDPEAQTEGKAAVRTETCRRRSSSARSGCARVCTFTSTPDAGRRSAAAGLKTPVEDPPRRDSFV